MARVRTYAKWLALVIVLLVAAQSASPYMLRNRRVRTYLLDHLEKSFGRRVEAQDFSMNLLPFPEMEMDGVTIAEDPAFGREYFLRADRLTAGVRWLGLLRGHFDFGTISLSRPSLILVRNEQGRWNLQGWLPPAGQYSRPAGVFYGPRRDAESANHLQKIEFDEGRINFKTGDEKRPFAFIGVSGSVEQTGPGRWQLRLEAQPWRSGVALQSTGTIQVRGEVAGTSARLQPAEIQVHWEKASLADLFRLTSGYDFGVRGDFALDGNASVGKPEPGKPAIPGIWKFTLHARAARIHRWDLIERGDNPGLSLHLIGLWDVAAGEAHAETAALDLPRSHFEGSASLRTAGMSEWAAQVKDAGIQATDVLAWYRAFQPDVAESVSARQFFKARFALHGRPLAWDDAEISSDGGELALPGFAKPVRIGSVQGNTSKNHFQLLPVRIFLDGVEKERGTTAKPAKTNSNTESVPTAQDQIELRFVQDFREPSRTLSAAGRLRDANSLFKAAAAFGLPLNAGWELTGGAAGMFERTWNTAERSNRWTGSVSLSKAQLQAAGLNFPLQLEEVRVAWTPDARNVSITRADAFGAAWTGTIEEHLPAEEASAQQWGFQLHANHLDAKDLDLWFGPRSRPNWLQRLLPSLLGRSQTSAKPSELLRRISAEGDVTADSMAIEKVKLSNPRAHLVFRDLHLEVKDASADWAGGKVLGNLTAVFSEPPQYEISVEVDHANLSQFPWGARWTDRWSGTASGSVRLKTAGVGREALLGHLTGDAEVHLKSPELHGWDVPASLDTGTVHTGNSRWATGGGTFTIQDRTVHFVGLELEDPKERLKLTGNFDFAQNLSLNFSREAAAERKTKSAMPPRKFVLAGPMETPVASISAAPAARPERGKEQ